MYPPLQGGIKPGVDNLPFHVLSNSIRSYQDDEGMMMKGCVKWNTVYDLDDLSLGSPRSAGQRLTHWAIMAKTCSKSIYIYMYSISDGCHGYNEVIWLKMIYVLFLDVMHKKWVG